ncbi:hypothetical protein TNCV_2604481 [Trichonephila clavipes]|nr:hypothetical protein TNCV_2604481 [Trichonephila clavipes]
MLSRVHQNLVEHGSFRGAIDDPPVNSEMDLVACISIAAVCLHAAYLPKEYGISVALTFDDKILIEKSMSENLIPLLCGPILKCLALAQRNSAVGLCNQGLMGGSMTMEAKQMRFLVNSKYRNRSPKCLLVLLEYVGHRFVIVYSNFSGHHLSASIS